MISIIIDQNHICTKCDSVSLCHWQLLLVVVLLVVVVAPAALVQ